MNKSSSCIKLVLGFQKSHANHFHENLKSYSILDESLTSDLNTQPSFANAALLNALPIGIYLCNSDGLIIQYNDAAVNIWGELPTENSRWIVAKNILDADGNNIALVDFPIKNAIQKLRKMAPTEVIIRRSNGSNCTVCVELHLLFSSTSVFESAVITMTNITENRALSQKLDESNSRIESLLQQLENQNRLRHVKIPKSEEAYYKMIDEVQDYAILLLDLHGNILNWNLGAEKIKGYTEQEIIGKNFRIFYLDEDRKNNLPQKLIDSAVANGKAMHEGWRLRKDGTRFWGYIIITALHDDQNNIIGFSKVTRDLTERKIAEDQLYEYARNIELKNLQLEEFAFVASHDLQEPLRKIQTFADILERDIDKKEIVAKNVKKISDSARRMSRLIKDILKYSQIVHSTALHENANLNDILADVESDLDLLISEKNAVLTSDELPIITGIPIQIHQLFYNLIGNALKFNERKPEIHIKSEIVRGEDCRDCNLLQPLRQYHKISIKDNGVGFDQRYADQIFKLFQRLDSDAKGTGIGLTLCKRIVENHGGQITVESEIDHGTTFTIYLPA